MGKKMYYTEQEAAQRLGVPVEGLGKFVRDDKLRVFQDGPRRMFRVDEIDALAGGPEEIELTPTPLDTVSLTEAERTGEGGKEDTVITAEGISIFDDEDLEIEAADPMAKTQIAPSIEDQVALEGVGSGSGLLDLTRESDDTSLGAEVLDHIDLEGEAAAAAPTVVPPAPTAIPQEPVMEPAIVITPTFVEAIDPSAGLFGGIVVGCAIVAALLGAVALGTVGTVAPGYIATLQANVLLVLIVCLVIVLLGAVLGWLAGKASSARQEALRQMGM